MAGLVELLAGEPAAAERELRWGYVTLREIGEMSYLSTLVALLAEAVYRQGRYQEAQELTRESEESAGGEDVYSQVLWRSVRAKTLARMDQVQEAERLSREAVDLAEATDSVQLRAEALLGLGEVLDLGGRGVEARPFIEEAGKLFEQKGNIVAAGRARERLGALAT
jgi:tetratricopeptide (TPR) repeat protein